MVHEGLIPAFFYAFAGLAVFCGLMVITQNNPVRCVLFLVLAFIASSVLWILVDAEFLGLILVLVYVGAVMTLFLFVIMMLNIDVETQKSRFIRHAPMGLLGVALLVGLLWKVMPPLDFTTAVESGRQVVLYQSHVSNTEALGMVLYTHYVLAFELAAVILLVAIVAAISLMQRQASRSKKQSILKQLMARPHDRVQLIKMNASARSK